MATNIKGFSAVLGLFLTTGWAMAQPPTVSTPPTLPTIRADELSRLIGGPTLVSLKLKNATPQQVLAEIAKQTGLTARDYSTPAGVAQPTNVPTSIEVERRAFWPALHEVGEKLNMTFSVYNDSLSLSPRQQNNRLLMGRTFSAGPFVTISAQQLVTTQTVVLSDTPALPETQKTLHISGMVRMDPKVRVLRQFVVGELNSAQDEKGRSLLPEKPIFTMNSHGLPQWYFHLPLVAHPAMSGQARLTGKLRFPVVLSQERWEVTDLKAKDNSKTVTGPRGPEKYTLQEVKSENNGFVVRINVERPAGAPDILPQIWSGRTELAQLFDKSGKPVFNLRSSVDGSKIEFRFWNGSKGGQPARMVMDIPVDVRHLEVPFELSGLPLP